MCVRPCHLRALGAILLHLLVATVSAAPSAPRAPSQSQLKDVPTHTYDVLILGGGVAGIAAAQQLTKAGITNYLIVEAHEELGGRMRSYDFAGTNIELGCNWVEGTQFGECLEAYLVRES